MARSKPARKSKAAGAPVAAALLTLPQAAELIGLTPAELAEIIREAGIEASGPEAEWRLEAVDVLALKSQREKRARQNRSELERLGGALPEE